MCSGRRSTHIVYLCKSKIIMVLKCSVTSTIHAFTKQQGRPVKVQVGYEVAGMMLNL